MRLIAVLITDVVNPLFMISLALFASVGYILTLLMPVAIDVWQAVFWVCTLLPLMGLLARVYVKWKQDAYVKSRASWRMALPFIPLLVLAPMLYAEFSLPGLQVWAHADIRLGYMNQLLYGSTPVENIFAAGHPPSYYWLYHAYMAAVAKITSLHPLQAEEIVNIAAIFSGLLWIARTLIALKLAKPRTVYLGAAVILVYFAVNITGILSLAAYLANGNAMPKGGGTAVLRVLLLEGADRRLHSVLIKVFSASSMTLGIAAFSAVFYTCVKALKGKIDLMALILASACGIAMLALRPDITLHIAALLGGLALTGGIGLMGRANKVGRMRAFWHQASREVSPSAWLLWLIISLALSIPLLKYILDISAGIPGLRLDLFNAANLRMIAAAILLLIPLFALQCVFAARKRDAAQYFVQISFLILVALTSSLLLSDNNQYKGVYLLAVFIAVSALFALQGLQQSSRIAWRRMGRALVTAWFILVFLQIIYASYFAWNKAANGVYKSGVYKAVEYDGAHLKYEGDFDDNRAAAYYWIRGNTPADSIIILPLEASQWSNLLHERLLYVKAPQFFYTETIEDYDERVSHLEVFYNEAAAMDDYKMLIEDMTGSLPGRPIYAVVKDEEVSPEVMRRRGAALVYEDEYDGANVYRLNPEAGG